MIIELNDLLTIDDKEYIVKNITDVDDKTYYSLVNINDITDFKFCYLLGGELFEELDKDNIFKLVSHIDINNI